MNYLREIHNGTKIVLSELMVEVAPNEYVAEKALGLVRGQKPTNDVVKPQNVPIGTSLRPWRIWLREDDIVREQWWRGLTPVDKPLRMRYL